MLKAKTNTDNIFSNYTMFLKELSSKKVTLGFDGFVDSIVKIVKQKNERGNNFYFETSDDFASYIMAKQSKNFSFELQKQTSKLGGNMPIMANALARLGTTLSCIGTFGFPAIHPAFLTMPENCSLYSFAEPGLSTALEFKNSKILMAEMKGGSQVDWKTIEGVLGNEKLGELFSNRHLICLLNWSEMENATNIWQGLLKNILPHAANPEGKPIGFFDFSDCSREAPSKIMEALDLIKEFSTYWDVTLSLNLNEATVVYNALFKAEQSDLGVHEMGVAIYDTLKIANVVIHHSSEAVCWNNDGSHREESMMVEKPRLLTGAGDNFNAGFCVGLLLGMSGGNSLRIAHAVSAHYLRYGESPMLDKIFPILDDKLKGTASKNSK